MSQEGTKKTPTKVHPTDQESKPLSISKMDENEVEDYLEKVSGGVASDTAKIRICECCILIAEA